MKSRKAETRGIIESANAAYLDRDKAFHQIAEIKKLMLARQV